MGIHVCSIQKYLENITSHKVVHSKAFFGTVLKNFFHLCEIRPISSTLQMLWIVQNEKSLLAGSEISLQVYLPYERGMLIGCIHSYLKIYRLSPYGLKSTDFDDPIFYFRLRIASRENGAFFTIFFQIVVLPLRFGVLGNPCPKSATLSGRKLTF